MITIKETSREFSEVEQYLMTIAPSIISVKDLADGEKIVVDGTLIFEDTKDGNYEPVEILSIITPDKKVYSCQSSTFKRSVSDIVGIMHGKQFAIIKTSGKTKAGRDFINCELDLSSVG